MISLKMIHTLTLAFSVAIVALNTGNRTLCDSDIPNINAGVGCITLFGPCQIALPWG
jgi:hypothetical protein